MSQSRQRSRLLRLTDVLDLEIVRVERVNLEEDRLCFRPHVADHVEQSLDLAAESHLIFDGKRVVVAVLEDVAIEHVLLTQHVSASKTRSLTDACENSPESPKHHLRPGRSPARSP